MKTRHEECDGRSAASGQELGCIASMARRVSVRGAVVSRAGRLTAERRFGIILSVRGGEIL